MAAREYKNRYERARARRWRYKSCYSNECTEQTRDRHNEKRKSKRRELADRSTMYAFAEQDFEDYTPRELRDY